MINISKLPRIKDWRIAVGLVFAPFVGVMIATIIDQFIIDKIAQVHPWTLASLIWPNGGRSSGAVFPLWLVPGWTFHYLVTFLIGIPGLVLLKKYNCLQLWHHVAAFAALGFAFKILAITSFFFVLLLNKGDWVNWLANLFSWDSLSFFAPMITATTIYGMAAAASFWFISICCNPVYIKAKNLQSILNLPKPDTPSKP